VVDAEAEARPEDYADRPGYDPDFLGTQLPLPDIHDDGDVLRFWFDGQKRHELRYQHFSLVMSQRRRVCWYSAVNIDGAQSRRATRPAWRRDPRIDSDAQILKQCYGNAPRFARGHMTRREDPIWGRRAAALRDGADSMHVTNAVPQMQTFNAGIWLELEDYALEHTREDQMRVSVITGPVLDPRDPILYEVQIPRRFWKVILFVHDQLGEPCVTGYTLDQSKFLQDEEFVFGRHETAQVSITEIERLAGVSFPDELRRLDPLERGEESPPRPLDDLRDIRFR
jgi:endonuclease G